MPRIIQELPSEVVARMNGRKKNTVTCLDSSITPTEEGTHRFELVSGEDFIASDVDSLKNDRTATYNFIASHYRVLRDESDGHEFTHVVREIATDIEGNDLPLADWSIYVELNLIDRLSDEGLAMKHQRSIKVAISRTT